MIAYKLSDDCHELGYFKSQKDVAYYIKNDEDIAEWYEDYEEFKDIHTINSLIICVLRS